MAWKWLCCTVSGLFWTSYNMLKFQNVFNVLNHKLIVRFSLISGHWGQVWWQICTFILMLRWLLFRWYNLNTKKRTVSNFAAAVMHANNHDKTQTTSTQQSYLIRLWKTFNSQRHGVNVDFFVPHYHHCHLHLSNVFHLLSLCRPSQLHLWHFFGALPLVILLCRC